MVPLSLVCHVSTLVPSRPAFRFHFAFMENHDGMKRNAQHFGDKAGTPLDMVSKAESVFLALIVSCFFLGT